MTEQQPVAIYQVSMAPGEYRDISKRSYVYNMAHGHANICRIVYAEPIDATLIGWWDSTEASGFRWKEGIVRSEFSNGTPIYAASAPRAK